MLYDKYGESHRVDNFAYFPKFANTDNEWAVEFDGVNNVRMFVSQMYLTQPEPDSWKKLEEDLNNGISGASPCCAYAAVKPVRAISAVLKAHAIALAEYSPTFVIAFANWEVKVNSSIASLLITIMEKDTIYVFKQILDTIQELEKVGSPIGFEYCVYEMPQKECEDICIILQKLGYNAIIGHRLGSESTITVMKE